MINEIASDTKGNDSAFVEAYRSIFATTPEDELVHDKEKLKKTMEENLRAKEALVGAKEFNDKVLRPFYLYKIDKGWVDHLDVLTDIKDAAMLQTYANKNPLIEYKKNAVEAFEELLDSIMKSVCRFANLVRITTNPIISRGSVYSRSTTSAKNNPSRISRPQGSVVSSQAQASNTVIKRAMPKIGRNDPCPCGSGKKYKNCCGRHVQE